MLFRSMLGGVGILYRSVLLPLSEDGVTIDHVLGAANYRTLSADEEELTMQVTSETHWLEAVALVAEGAAAQ